MASKVRGRAIILNNEKFVHMGDRNGSQYDTVNASELFKLLGFETKVWNNLTAKVSNTFIMITVQASVRRNISKSVLNGCWIP